MFCTGPVVNYPQLVLVREGPLNVPRPESHPLNGYVNTGKLPLPAAYDPEAYYCEDQESHM